MHRNEKVRIMTEWEGWDYELINIKYLNMFCFFNMYPIVSEICSFFDLIFLLNIDTQRTIRLKGENRHLRPTIGQRHGKHVA